MSVVASAALGGASHPFDGAVGLLVDELLKRGDRVPGAGGPALGVPEGRLHRGDELVLLEELLVVLFGRFGIADTEHQRPFFLVRAEHDGLDGDLGGRGGLFLLVLLSRDAAGGDEDQDGNNTRSISHVYDTLHNTIPMSLNAHFSIPNKGIHLRPPCIIDETSTPVYLHWLGAGASIF